MDKHHLYQLAVKWTGNRGGGTTSYCAYDRNYKISIENKIDIFGSSDPAFRGDYSKHNPEELFVASISTCHMLWYLHLCADAGIVVVEYTDHAEGVLKESKDGSGQFVQVTLNPVVIISDTSNVDIAIELHQKANTFCFIANSCNFPINHKPICKFQYA